MITCLIHVACVPRRRRRHCHTIDLAERKHWDTNGANKFLYDGTCYKRAMQQYAAMQIPSCCALRFLASGAALAELRNCKPAWEICKLCKRQQQTLSSQRHLNKQLKMEIPKSLRKAFSGSMWASLPCLHPSAEKHREKLETFEETALKTLEIHHKTVCLYIQNKGKSSQRKCTKQLLAATTSLMRFKSTLCQTPHVSHVHSHASSDRLIKKCNCFSTVSSLNPFIQLSLRLWFP